MCPGTLGDLRKRIYQVLVPHLRGVRGVFELMVQTQKHPPTPLRGEFDLGFLNKFHKYSIICP